jgi:hypothetical protein
MARLLRRGRIRIGTQDVKIASMALSRDATLLWANLRDFQRVPGLRVEDWLSNQTCPVSLAFDDFPKTDQTLWPADAS